MSDPAEPRRTRRHAASRQPRSYCCRKAFKQVYQFKIVLQDVEPVVWRSVQVPEVYSFWDLHCAITDAFGWLDYHLHQFSIVFPESGETDLIGIPDEDRIEDDPEVLPGWHLYLAEYFTPENRSCEYLYDFGDGWHHRVALEAVLPREKDICYPRCVGGERACPPEDVGGPGGYRRFLKAIRYLNAQDHDELLQWVGGWFDPEWFDLRLVRFENPALRWRIAFRHAPHPKTMRMVQYHRMRESTSP